MLEFVKLVLRLKTAAFDAEIQGLISTAIADLRAAGIDATAETNDARIKQAVVLYCKANFGIDNAGGERYQASYEMLRIALALDGGEPDVV